MLLLLSPKCAAHIGIMHLHGYTICIVAAPGGPGGGGPAGGQRSLHSRGALRVRPLQQPRLQAAAGGRPGVLPTRAPQRPTAGGPSWPGRIGGGDGVCGRRLCGVEAEGASYGRGCRGGHAEGAMQEVRALAVPGVSRRLAEVGLMAEME